MKQVSQSATEFSFYLVRKSVTVDSVPILQEKHWNNGVLFKWNRISLKKFMNKIHAYKFNGICILGSV